jgi:hypothetical protein
MSEVLVIDEVTAPAATVWDLVKEFGGILKWSAGAVESVTVEGDGVGAVRTLSIVGGATLQEKLEAYDESGRSFSYSFVGEVILPVADYYATLTIRDGAAGPGSSRVEWGSTFEPKEIPEAQAVSMIEGIYKNGIGGIKQALEA